MAYRVLVTDGEQRAALAVVRSLGAAGHEVFVCGPRRRTLAGASRFSRHQRQVPSALDEPQRFTECVAGLVREWQIDCAVPITEASLLAVLGATDEYAGVLLPFPDVDRFRAVADKSRVLAAAARQGLHVPGQVCLENPQDARGDHLDALQFPVAVKATRSVAERNGTRHKTGVAYAASLDDLPAALAEFPAGAYPLLVQERIVGPGTGVFLLVWDGAVVAAFAHRRLREKPPSGGVSVFRESVPLDPTLMQQSAALLREFGWRGVAMIEFKRDTATNRTCLMEINGRFWGSLQLAIDAGVDFPALLLDAARGLAPTPVLDYRLGVRSQWWWGDVDHVLARLRHSPRRLALAQDAPGRFRTVADFLHASAFGGRREVFRFTDPRPFARETFDWLSGR